MLNSEHPTRRGQGECMQEIELWGLTTTTF